MTSSFSASPASTALKLEAHIAKLRVDGQLADNLKLTSTLLYGDYDKIYRECLTPMAQRHRRQALVALDAYSDPTKRENLIAQANLIWDVETGALAHKILFGVEYGDQKTRNQRLNRVFSADQQLQPGQSGFPDGNLHHAVARYRVRRRVFLRLCAGPDQHR